MSEFTKNDFYVDETKRIKKKIIINGKEAIFVFKELSGRDEDLIGQESVKMNPISKKIEIDQEEANTQYLLKSIVEAPEGFELTREGLAKVKAPIRKALLRIAKGINGVELKVVDF